MTDEEAEAFVGTVADIQHDILSHGAFTDKQWQLMAVATGQSLKQAMIKHGLIAG
jgi:hypothetical protein